jgi:hypothetical protein
MELYLHSPNTPLWRDAWLSTDKFTFTFNTFTLIYGSFIVFDVAWEILKKCWDMLCETLFVRVWKLNHKTKRIFEVIFSEM